MDAAALSAMPNDILIIIMGYINSDDRARMCSVCRKFTPLALFVTQNMSECPWLWPNATPNAHRQYQMRFADLAVLVRYGSYHEISLCKNLVKPLMDSTHKHGSLLMKAFECGNIATMEIIIKITECRIDDNHMIVMCERGNIPALRYLQSLGELNDKYGRDVLKTCMRVAHGNTPVEDIIADIKPIIGSKVSRMVGNIANYLNPYHYPDFTSSTLAKSERQPWHNNIIAMTSVHMEKIVWINFKDDVGVNDPTLHDEFLDYATNHLPCVYYDILQGETDCDSDDSDEDKFMLLSRDHVVKAISESLIRRDIINPDTIVTVLFGMASDNPWNNIHKVIESLKSGVQIKGVAVMVNVVVFNTMDEDGPAPELDSEKYSVHDHVDIGDAPIRNHHQRRRPQIGVSTSYAS